MRAEVGLLTRNVKYRGDSNSRRDKYGAHIMMHSSGDDSLSGKIAYTEFEDVGQAFQLGRYPIHFHMIGRVHNSYVKGNAIHHTYNRAVTIHGVHYLTIQKNVAYHTMGHTFFIEDAAETKNLLEDNLAVQTMASTSLLNTDQTPGSFWITHPDNIFRRNRAAGSERYGYWFDLQDNSIGPSASKSICPKNARLGEFVDNQAHTCGRYGLRIFHEHSPRQDPCKPISDTNPAVEAVYENFLGWKCNRNGVIASFVGAVTIKDATVVDNKMAGIEFEAVIEDTPQITKVKGGRIVGYKDASDTDFYSNSERDGKWHNGIIAPRSDHLLIDGPKFYRWDKNHFSALSTCSHCFHPAATDSGARTITTKNLAFDTTVSKKIMYSDPKKAIFHDLDGTLTGLNAGSWATVGFKFNEQSSACSASADHDGIVCDETVEVRRVSLYGEFRS